MMGTAIDLIIGPIGAAIAALAAMVLAYLKGRSTERKNSQHERMRDVQDRIDKGRQHIRERRGGDPSDRVRENDKQW